LLAGKGFFTEKKKFEDGWRPAMGKTVDAYEISVADQALSLRKKATAKVDYDDGVIIEIPGSEKPRHLQFFCKSSAGGDAETCDIRLTKLKSQP